MTAFLLLLITNLVTIQGNRSVTNGILEELRIVPKCSGLSLGMDADARQARVLDQRTKRRLVRQTSIDRSARLEISASEGRGEKRVAKRGMYVAHTVQILNRRRPDEVPEFEIVRPFESNELVSRNLLTSGNSPQGWINFINKFGLIGRQPLLDRWDLFGRGTGKDKRHFICEVEHEGEWHHLRNVLGRIYRYHPAIRKRDSKTLSRFIYLGF